MHARDTADISVAPAVDRVIDSLWGVDVLDKVVPLILQDTPIDLLKKLQTSPQVSVESVVPEDRPFSPEEGAACCPFGNGRR